MAWNRADLRHLVTQVHGWFASRDMPRLPTTVPRQGPKVDP